jgi:hypothetical protein
MRRNLNEITVGRDNKMILLVKLFFSNVVTERSFAFGVGFLVTSAYILFFELADAFTTNLVLFVYLLKFDFHI